MQLYRYIELNPVRAKMVNEPADYPWTSYHVNALGKPSDLCTPHEQYLSLGNSHEKRLLAYCDLFKNIISHDLATDINVSVAKGLALGNDKFKTEIE